MPLSSRVLLSRLLLLIIAGSTGAFSSRQGECSFPARWEGKWFQSGVRQSIDILKNELSTKGKCLHNEGDKFLLVDSKSCYRCVVIHEKHPNVLQYKETFCHSKNSLASLCSYITGDALLYSMFREEAPPVACPFRGPMTFSYNRGHGTCSNPPSNVDTCTDDSRLLFKYQACPDVSASESAVEELECLATWKEGSSRYLVGRLHHGHASSNEDRYRCFVYEKAGQTVQGNLNRAAMGIGAMDHEVALPGGPVPEGSAEVYRVAQSGDATCNGLFSPMEGSRTMTLRKVSSPGECRFPIWLTGHLSSGLTWHTLDLGRSYTFHPRNASLHVARPNATSSSFESGSMDLQYVPGPEDQDVKILCNSIKQSNGAQTITMTMLVAHFTVGCRSGFMCMTFYRRDRHVIELQTGSAVSRPEEACSPPHFLQHSMPFLTLVTSSPEPRTCPYLGKFTVTDVNRNQRNTRESRRSQHQQGSLPIRHDGEKVRHAQERNEDRRSRKLDYEVEKRRANNEYLIHERMGRRARSNRGNRGHKDYSLEEIATSSKRSSELEDTFRDLQERALRSKVRRSGDHSEQRIAESLRSKTRRSRAVSRFEKHVSQEIEYAKVSNEGEIKDEINSKDKENRSRRYPIEDFRPNDADTIGRFWVVEDAWSSSSLQVQDDYFGDYLEVENPPRKRSASDNPTDKGYMTYKDLLRMKRELEERERDESVPERREKRNEDDSRCSSEVTTLTVGCSTADRMEFQSDCVDDDAITAYSCHGRWFDAEGTQFVIATPLARRTAWSNSESNNRAQPYRNSRRLCFMYKESGGVVSLTASPIACQRGIPPPTPMLAFNATSTGQCMETNGGRIRRSTYLTIVLLMAAAAIFR